MPKPNEHHEHNVAVPSASSTEAVPVAPSMVSLLQAEHLVRRPALIDKRTVVLSAIAVALACAAAVIAQILSWLIAFFTNLSFYSRVSFQPASPAGHHLGALVILVPVVGGLVVGLMARYGSQAIRGHGIPEAMERVLLHGSRIPARITFLKPLSSAIAIGTGGPFGAEGPVIATGGALGSLVGQLIRVTASERKTLLAAGAAAGMTATFGSPVSAVLLAVELLLFELNPRSLIPVVLACATAAGVRAGFVGTEPVFPMPSLAPASAEALASYLVLGALVGVASVYVTRAVYAVEDGFERLPIHWMWWPAIGAVAVGVVGYLEPHTMGVGYDNIEKIVSGQLAGRALVVLCALKFVSWVISLGSGTSGGTLAPMFTIGGGLGAALGAAAAHFAPSLGIDVRVAGLVGMAALFGGASRALLASVVFAFETTRQPAGLLPLLGGCGSAYLVSCLMMRHSIMTTKISRRGVAVPVAYGADALEHVSVGQCAARSVVTFDAEMTVDAARKQISSGTASARHGGFPVIDRGGNLVGVVTLRDLLEGAADGDAPLVGILKRAPIVVDEHAPLREAVELMAAWDIGRLPVVAREAPTKLKGILTRSDVMQAYRRRFDEEHRVEKSLEIRMPRMPRGRDRSEKLI